MRKIRKIDVVVAVAGVLIISSLIVNAFRHMESVGPLHERQVSEVVAPKQERPIYVDAGHVGGGREVASPQQMAFNYYNENMR